MNPNCERDPLTCRCWYHQGHVDEPPASQAVVSQDLVPVAEDNPLLDRLTGRAAFLRDRGEVKTPDLLEEAASAIEAAQIAARNDALEAVKRIESDIAWTKKHCPNAPYVGIPIEVAEQVVTALRTPSQHQEEQ